MTDVNPDYCPSPADTSGVHLTPDQTQVLDLLARNIHELWASRRMDEGWISGHARDDAHRVHPCLVPFDDLPIREQEYDRTIAAETLKLLLLLGFRISKG